MKRASPADLSYGAFAALLHTRFQVHVSETAALSVKLVEAIANRSRGTGASAQVTSFSLVFSGPANPFLPQRIYLFEHDQLGAFDLFIVPIGKEQNGFRYEAIFNSSAR